MTYLQVVQIRKSLVLCYLHSLCALRDSLSLRRNLIAIRIRSPQFISPSPLLTKRLDVRDILPLCPALHSSLWNFSKNSPEQHSSVPKQEEYSNPQQHSLSRSLCFARSASLSLSIRHNKQGEERTRTRGRWRRRVEHVARALRKRDTEVADVEAEQGVALQCEALWCNHQTADSGATKAAADGARGGLQHSPSEGMIAAKPNLHTKLTPRSLTQHRTPSHTAQPPSRLTAPNSFAPLSQ